MKRLIAICFIAIFIIACNSEEPENSKREVLNENYADIVQVEYVINTDESVVDWKGDMVGIYSHEGNLKFTDGTISIKNGKVENGSFSVNMNSMLTTDDDALYENSSREKLIGHLMSDDFFATGTFPTSNFIVKSKDGNKLIGDLTIRGITHSETVTNIVISQSDGAFTAEGKLIFDRQKYEITYENKMGDMILSDDIELQISLSGKSK